MQSSNSTIFPKHISKHETIFCWILLRDTDIDGSIDSIKYFLKRKRTLNLHLNSLVNLFATTENVLS